MNGINGGRIKWICIVFDCIQSSSLQCLPKCSSKQRSSNVAVCEFAPPIEQNRGTSFTHQCSKQWRSAQVFSSKYYSKVYLAAKIIKQIISIQMLFQTQIAYATFFVICRCMLSHIVADALLLSFARLSPRRGIVQIWNILVPQSVDVQTLLSYVTRWIHSPPIYFTGIIYICLKKYTVLIEKCKSFKIAIPSKINKCYVKKPIPYIFFGRFSLHS